MPSCTGSASWYYTDCMHFSVEPIYLALVSLLEEISYCMQEATTETNGYEPTFEVD